MDLFEWRWHHFRPFNKAENYLPLLEIFAAHDGEAIDDVRLDIGQEAEALSLGVALGARSAGRPDLIRDRFDIWRFTGAIFEPGLVEETIQLTPLGLALAAGRADFGDAMRGQARRLRFPYLRVRRSNELENLAEELNEALGLGGGVNVTEAWVLASQLLVDMGEESPMTGEEAARFLSGVPTLDDVPDRVESLVMQRKGRGGTYPDVSNDKKRQGRELKIWLDANGADTTADGLELSYSDFEFQSASTDEIQRWNEWWGAWPPPFVSPDQNGMDQGATEFGSTRTTIFAAAPDLPNLNANETEDPTILSIDVTDGLALVNVRLEQRSLRKSLFGGSDEADCVFCQRRFPVNALRAAHIKKRSVCVYSERVDTSNVVAACTLGCDHLFELGYIFVDHNGVIRAGRDEPSSSDLSDAVMQIDGSQCPAFDENSAKYFEAHRSGLGLADP